MHGGLKMAEIMVPRDDILTQPRLYGFEILGSREAYTQGGSQLPSVSFPSPALPIVIRDGIGLDMELFGHIVDGR